MTDEEMKIAMLMAVRGEKTILSPEQFKIATQMRADEIMRKAEYEGLGSGIAMLMDLLAD